MNVKSKVASCVFLLGVGLLVYFFSVQNLSEKDEATNESGSYPVRKRNNGFIARDVSFVYGNRSSSNLHVYGSVDLIRRDFPKIGPFKVNMTRTFVIEGVDLHVNKNSEPPEKLLENNLSRLLPNIRGAKLLIKNLTITSNEGKKTYETFEP